MRDLTSKLLLGLAIALAILAGVLWWRERQAAAAARAAQNALAAADTTRVIRVVGDTAVLERLSFVVGQLHSLGGELETVRRANHETAIAYSALRLAFDSLVARTGGTVEADTAVPGVRILTAGLDTAGYHVGIRAAVPAPPGVADVTWHLRQDTTAILTSLTRGPSGQAFWRAQLVHGSALRLLADSVVLADQPLRTRGIPLRTVAWSAAGCVAGVGLVKVLTAILP